MVIVDPLWAQNDCLDKTFQMSHRWILWDEYFSRYRRKTPEKGRVHKNTDPSLGPSSYYSNNEYYQFYSGNMSDMPWILLIKKILTKLIILFGQNWVLGVVDILSSAPPHPRHSCSRWIFMVRPRKNYSPKLSVVLVKTYIYNIYLDRTGTCCFLLKIGHFGWKMAKLIREKLLPLFCVFVWIMIYC